MSDGHSLLKHPRLTQPYEPHGQEAEHSRNPQSSQGRLHSRKRSMNSSYSHRYNSGHVSRAQHSSSLAPRPDNPNTVVRKICS